MGVLTAVGLAALAATSLVGAVPVLEDWQLDLIEARQAGADSCPTDTLNSDTWMANDLDNWLRDWVDANVADATENYVQAVADSMGAPNFFCGLDSFCNAGQPCLPVDPPGWYAMLAIQNWNQYLNSLNTAVTFASSIMSLTMGKIVTDLYPAPEDTITPFKQLIVAFNSILGVIPVAGAVGVGVNSVIGAGQYLNLNLNVPSPTDGQFIAWTDITASLGEGVKLWQGAISGHVDEKVNMPFNDPGGMTDLLSGGYFLGQAQNFTQDDVAGVMTNTLTRYSIGLVLQAQLIFVVRSFGVAPCPDNDLPDAEICIDRGDGTIEQQMLIASDDDGNAEPQTDIGYALSSIYGMPPDEYITGPLRCYDGNGKTQLAAPWGDFLPTDPTDQCVYNVLVCDQTEAASDLGIVGDCQAQGLAV